MNGQEQLPDELVWRADGHVADVALTALADGQAAIVPDDAQQHIGECAECTMRLGQEALLSLDVAQALGEGPSSQQTSGVWDLTPPPVIELRRDFPLPWLAVAAALMLAVAGAVPGIFQSVRSAPRLADAFNGVPLAVGAASQLVRGLGQVGSTAWTVAWCTSAVLLLAVGIYVARRRDARPAKVKGGQV